MSLGLFATAASLHANEINVDIGFEQIEFTAQSPTVVDGHTFVPIREVFEALGFRAEWNPAVQAITLVRGETIVIITIGSDVFTIDGTEHPLETPARIIKDTTMLPIRNVLEALGYYVGWNATTSTMQIGLFPASGIDHRPADNFRHFATDYAFLDWGIIVLEYDDGALWAMQFRTGNLLKSTDQGETWAVAYRFARPINAIYADGHGNLFVATTLDRWAAYGTGEVFKSTDNGESFRHVLDIEAGAPMRWNIASQDGVMFISEYGYKWLDNNARRIYRSLDFGETWTVIFEPDPVNDHHNHKILITENGIIYQSVGDGRNSQIIRSTDNGYTWTTVVRGLQPTSGIVFDTHILWGLDGGPWHGIARYDRQTGEITRALTLPAPFAGHSYDMIATQGMVIAMFLSYEGYDFPGSIFYSRNEGATWHLLGYIEKPAHFGVGLNHIVSDGQYAYIDIGAPVYRDGAYSRFRGTLRISLINEVQEEKDEEN